MREVAIGGYLSLERGKGTGLPWINEATGYRSARSAIAALLTAARPTAVWVPNFICGAVNDALRQTNMKINRYPLTRSFGVPDQVALAPADLIICVNYFGICAQEVNCAIDRFGPSHVLVDASQALYHPHRNGSTTVYSPRKYLGVPDGGLIRTSLELPPQIDAIEADSIARSQHLLYRLAGLTDIGYLKFHEAEKSLEDCDPIAMSTLTKAILNSIDVETIATIRIRNYNCLVTSLQSTNLNVLPLTPGTVPLCCPVQWVDAPRVNKELAARSIFAPSYWPDAAIPRDDHTALALRDRTIYLPCDQRYTPNDMQTVHNALMESLEYS